MTDGWNRNIGGGMTDDILRMILNLQRLRLRKELSSKLDLFEIVQSLNVTWGLITSCKKLIQEVCSIMNIESTGLIK